MLPTLCIVKHISTATLSLKTKLQADTKLLVWCKNRMQDSVYHHVGHCEEVRTMCCNNEPGARWPHNCHINVGWYLNLTASPWLPHLILVAGRASGWRAVCWLLNVCIPPGNVGGSQVSKPWRYYPFKISKNYPRPLPSLARVFRLFSSHSCRAIIILTGQSHISDQNAQFWAI